MTRRRVTRRRVRGPYGHTIDDALTRRRRRRRRRVMRIVTRRRRRVDANRDSSTRCVVDAM